MDFITFHGRAGGKWSSIPLPCIITTFPGQTSDVMLGSAFTDQLYKGLIHHRQRHRKQKAKAMLVQHCPPCLPVRGTAALHRRKINALQISPGKQHYILKKLAVCSQKENKCCESKGKLPCYFSISTLQEDLCTQYSLFAGWKSTRHIVCQEQFIKPVCAVFIDCQGPHAQNEVSSDIHTGGVKWKIWP